MTYSVVLNYPVSTNVEIVPLGSYSAGNLPLNVNTYSENGMYVIPGYQREISLTSLQNLSAINFVFTGYNVYNQVITETIAGPNANTVYTTNQYYKIISISASAVITAPNEVSIGYGRTGTSILVPAYPVANYYAPISAATAVTGTIVYTVYKTLDPLTVTSTPTRFAFDTVFNGAAANQIASISGPISATQVVMSTNNTTSTGSLITTILQGGLGL